MFSHVDWQTMFVPEISLVEIFLRGTIIYLLLFVYFRFMRREAGSVGISDLLFVVLIADAVQNAMANEYRSLTEGILLVATLAAWDLLLNWLAFKSKLMERIIVGDSVLLVKNGRMLRRNMRQEMLTRDELESQIRLEGVGSIEEVKECRLESDGKISVVKR